jgi:hypothetical protein
VIGGRHHDRRLQRSARHLAPDRRETARELFQTAEAAGRLGLGVEEKAGLARRLVPWPRDPNDDGVEGAGHVGATSSKESALPATMR